MKHQTAKKSKNNSGNKQRRITWEDDIQLSRDEFLKILRKVSKSTQTDPEKKET